MVSSQVGPWPASCLLKVPDKVTPKFLCPSPLHSLSLTSPGLTGPQGDVHAGSGTHQLVTWRPGPSASSPAGVLRTPPLPGSLRPAGRSK